MHRVQIIQARRSPEPRVREDHDDPQKAVTGSRMSLGKGADVRLRDLYRAIYRMTSRVRYSSRSLYQALNGKVNAHQEHTAPTRLESRSPVPELSLK